MNAAELLGSLSMYQSLLERLVDEVEFYLLPYCGKCNHGEPLHPAYARHDGQCERCGEARRVVALARAELGDAAEQG